MEQTATAAARSPLPAVPTGASPAAPAGPRPRVAIVLFNLGGPDAPESIRPFLVNLFTDPAILRVPGWVRPWLGRLIAWRRTKPATENYAVLGGKSPLLELTEEQGRSLDAALAAAPFEARSFIAMRYWHPMSDATARAVKAWNPDEILLLPLYPQFSTTTTGSSIAAWDRAASRAGLERPTTILCCWHSDTGYAAATAGLVREAWDKARASLPAEVPLRILFSAHGLPESIVEQGDPYQWQVEQTVQQVVGHLGIERLDHVVCYQSRVTPQKWTGQGGGAGLPHRVRLGALGDAGRARCRIPRGSRAFWRAWLLPGTCAEQRTSLHRRAARSRVARSWPGNAN